MARSLAAALAVFFGISGRDLPAPVEDHRLPTVADAPPPYAPPTLTASMRSPDARSQIGFASVDLSARPESHEIRVSLMIGAPVASLRWGACRTVVLDIDGAIAKVEARYSGVPMAAGVFDAVAAEVTIDHVRAMTTARAVRASLCGDVVELDAAERASLAGFVAGFEERATYDGPPPPPPPRPVDIELDAAEPLPERPVPA